MSRRTYPARLASKKMGETGHAADRGAIKANGATGRGCETSDASETVSSCAASCEDYWSFELDAWISAWPAIKAPPLCSIKKQTIHPSINHAVARACCWSKAADDEKAISIVVMLCSLVSWVEGLAGKECACAAALRSSESRQIVSTEQQDRIVASQTSPQRSPQKQWATTLRFVALLTSGHHQ